VASDTPLNELVLAAASLSDDLGFVAMADLSAALAELTDVESRIIGGHMVTLHVQRWRLGRDLYRETRDTDLGIPPIAVKDGRLIDLLKQRGYIRTTGNTYARLIDAVPGSVEDRQELSASIDLLVPAYTSKARDSVKVSEDLTTTEVLGLAEALQRPPVEVSLELQRLNGDMLYAELTLPDEASAVMLKALVWQRRSASKDAVDLWRTLEVAAAAGVSPDEFSLGPGKKSAEITRQSFEQVRGGAMKAITSAQGLSDQAVQERHTRIQALLQRVFG
jgi:phage tail protein X